MSEDDSILAKICTRTTCHGPLDFYQAKGWGRLFWGLITLGAFIAIGYYTYQLVVQYLMNQTATNVALINADKLLFPNITICNPSRYNATYIMESVSTVPYVPDSSDDFKRQYVRYLRTLSGSVEGFSEDDEGLVRNLETVYQQMFNTSIVPTARNISQYLQQATFDCEKYLVQCQFAQQPFNCCDFVRMPFNDNGFCYTIDIRSSASVDGYQTSSGENFGMDVTIQMNMNDIILMSQHEEIGIRVHVVDYATNMDFNPIGVPPSMHAHILLSPVHYVLSQGGDQCLPNGKPIPPFETYTKTLCEWRCLDDVVWELCQCVVLASFVERDNQLVCTPLQMMQCLFPRLIGTSDDANVYWDQVLKCYSTQCPKTCDYWSYATRTMYTEIGTSPDQNVTTDQNGTITMKLSVYFPDLTYEKYQEQLITDLPSFVSNVGGIVGLYAGISILTLIQFLIICVCGNCEGPAADETENTS